MSLATLDRPRIPLQPTPAWAPTHPRAAALAPIVEPAANPAALSPTRALRAVPEEKEARGVALYIGLDEAKAAAAGIDLSQLVAEIKRLTAALAPDAETHAAVALAPRGAGGRDVDVVRLALRDPSAVAKHRHVEEDEDDDRVDGVIIDLSRKRVTIDGEVAPLTYLEFELLQFLVLRVGQTVTRDDIVNGLWRGGEESPNARTVDVHVRRLRSKLGAYEDIVRTVRGSGYRYDKHADVAVTHTSSPSPDRL
ncbi:MAG: winged helix-turn-helix transcriptional regulator [Cryobacterium sp.]|nr:winged helix-turn-helix transcriptional regulator [Cryobacterium sp.]